MIKRNLMLLEILIGLGLLSLLLHFLFHSMTQGMKMEASLNQTRQIMLGRQHLQSRLQDLFLSLVPNQMPPLYTKAFPKEKKESLLLYFDNGVDPDPLFSGPVLGRIYLDEQNRLVLNLWPTEKKLKNRPWRKEILLENVSHFQFQFLGRKQTKEDLAVTAALAWQKHWSKQKTETPSMIRLSITQKDQEILFAFFLIGPEPRIVLVEKGMAS
jgi:hypothetical protein